MLMSLNYGNNLVTPWTWSTMPPEHTCNLDSLIGKRSHPQRKMIIVREKIYNLADNRSNYNRSNDNRSN